MGIPREVITAGKPGVGEIYTMLYPKNISPLTCTIGEGSDITVSVTQEKCSV